MEHLVNYSVVARKNPGDKESVAKFYAQAQASGVMGIQEICDRLQRECTLTRADIMAVLVGLESVVADGVRSGQIIRLGGLCSLQLSLSGKGAATEKAYTPALITTARVIFRPGQTLRMSMLNLSFKQVPKLAKTPGGSDGGVTV